MSGLKKFAVFDIDGTLIRWQLYHAIVDALIKMGAIEASAAEAIRESRANWKDRTHTDSFKQYESTLVKAFHKSLKNLKISDYEQAVDTVFNRYKDQTYTYTRDLVRRLKSEGYFLLAISGSPQEIITRLGEYYGFDLLIGAEMEKENGSFNGKQSEIVFKKAEILREIIETHHLDPTDSYGVGDSKGDVALLNQVSRPIAFNPDSGLLQTAQEEHWPVVIERKNVVYTLEYKNDAYQLVETN